MTKLEQAFKLFDAYNIQDPNKIFRDGEEYPSELFYALQLYNSIKRLERMPSEALLLASRCQHIGRWEMERKTYPEGRVGYLKWRSDLSKFHAKKAREILDSLHYDENITKKVTDIIVKKRLKTDPEVQTMENALCLVFLEFQYDDLIEKLSEEKMINILCKTWAKMSDPGKEIALSLKYSKKGALLLDKSLKK
jgi:hypothetical protein